MQRGPGDQPISVQRVREFRIVSLPILQRDVVIKRTQAVFNQRQLGQPGGGRCGFAFHAVAVPRKSPSRNEIVEPFQRFTSDSMHESNNALEFGAIPIPFDNLRQNVAGYQQ